MAQINVTENMIIELPDYDGSVNAADAARNLYEHLHDAVARHGGNLSVVQYSPMNAYVVTWDGGPKQWSHTYVATLIAPLVVVHASSCQSVEFSNLN